MKAKAEVIRGTRPVKFVGSSFPTSGDSTMRRKLLTLSCSLAIALALTITVWAGHRPNHPDPPNPPPGQCAGTNEGKCADLATSLGGTSDFSDGVCTITTGTSERETSVGPKTLVQECTTTFTVVKDGNECITSSSHETCDPVTCLNPQGREIPLTACGVH